MTFTTIKKLFTKRFFGPSSQPNKPITRSRLQVEEFEPRITMSATPVTPPTWLNVTPVSSTVANLNWRDVNGEDGYRIEYWNGNSVVQVGNVGANVTTFTASGLHPGQTEWFFVEAFNSVSAADSYWQSVTMPAARVSAPAWLNVSAISSSTAQLNWQDVANESGYRIFYWAGNTVVQVGSVASNVSTFTATGLHPGQTEWFFVEAFNSVSAADSYWQSVTMPAARVSAPAWLNVSAISSSTAQLNWQDVANESGYRIFYWAGNTVVQVGSVASNVSTFTATGLHPGQTEWFFVEAFNSVSAVDSYWQSVTMPAARVSAPAWLNVSAISSSTAQLNWQDVANESGYRIFYWAGNTVVQVGSVASNVSTFTATGLHPGQTEWFFVEAFNSVSAADSYWQSVTMPATSNLTQPDFTLAAYRQDNPLWRAGFAPISTNPPNPQLGGALGNCTWYSNGRLRELGYSSADLDKLTGNASTWANTARANGIPVGTLPVVGAIAQTTAGAGHVAIVERVNSDGTILISESSYYVDPVNHTGDFLWHLRTVTASSFQNYIYVRR